MLEPFSLDAVLIYSTCWIHNNSIR